VSRILETANDFRQSLTSNLPNASNSKCKQNDAPARLAKLLLPAQIRRCQCSGIAISTAPSVSKVERRLRFVLVDAE